MLNKLRVYDVCNLHTKVNILVSDIENLNIFEIIKQEIISYNLTLQEFFKRYKFESTKLYNIIRVINKTMLEVGKHIISFNLGILTGKIIFYNYTFWVSLFQAILLTFIMCSAVCLINFLNEMIRGQVYQDILYKNRINESIIHIIYNKYSKETIINEEVLQYIISIIKEEENKI